MVQLECAHELHATRSGLCLYAGDQLWQGSSGNQITNSTDAMDPHTHLQVGETVALQSLTRPLHLLDAGAEGADPAEAAVEAHVREYSVYSV
jgi:hypothetical protein